MDILERKLILCLITIFSHCNQARTTDCSFQAGAPCEIISSDDECATVGRDESSPYPTQPEFNIFPVTDETDIVTLNVTWKYGPNSSGILRGYEIRYWRYKDFEDASTSILDKCVLFNMTSDHQPSIKALFYHIYTESPTRYIQLAALPQIAPHKDYAHRVTAGFRQDDADSPAKWQPKLVVIHNDSCNGLVNIEFYLAPREFHFRKYRIGLSCKSERCKSQSEDIDVNEVDEKGQVRFQDVLNGKYTVKIIAEPNDINGDKCFCSPMPCDHGCVYSETGAFIIESDHLKCRNDASTEFTPTTGEENKPQEYIIIVIMLAIIFIVVFLLVITVITFGRKPMIILKHCMRNCSSSPHDQSEGSVCEQSVINVINANNEDVSVYYNQSNNKNKPCVQLDSVSTLTASSKVTKQLKKQNDAASDILAENTTQRSHQDTFSEVTYTSGFQV